jgi:putative mRNA 3-end processing factor
MGQPILFAYALGKAQRILAGLDGSNGPVLTHGAVEKVNPCYRDLGIIPPRLGNLSRTAKKISPKAPW